MVDNSAYCAWTFCLAAIYHCRLSPCRFTKLSQWLLSTNGPFAGFSTPDLRRRASCPSDRPAGQTHGNSTQKILRVISMQPTVWTTATMPQAVMRCVVRVVVSTVVCGATFVLVSAVKCHLPGRALNLKTLALPSDAEISRFELYLPCVVTPCHVSPHPHTSNLPV